MQKIAKLKYEMLKKHNNIFGEYPDPASYKNLFLNNDATIDDINKYIDTKINNLVDNMYNEHYSRSPTSEELKEAVNILNCNGSKIILNNRIISKKQNEKKNEPSKNYKMPKNVFTNNKISTMNPHTKTQTNNMVLNNTTQNIHKPIISTKIELNKLVDRIYVMNFEKYPHKFKAINDYLKRFDIEAVRYILQNPTDEKIYSDYTNILKNGSRIGNSSIYSYLLGYIDILKQAKKDNLKSILILDDNVMFHKNFNNELQKINKIPKDTGLIYLGCYQKEYTLEKINVSPGFYKAAQSYGSFAIIVKSLAYNLLLTDLEKKLFNPDQVFVNLQTLHPFYVLYENIIIVDLNDKNHINTGRIINITKSKIDLINKLFGWNKDNYNTSESIKGDNESIQISESKDSLKPDANVTNISEKNVAKPRLTRSEQINMNINNVIKNPLKKKEEKIKNINKLPAEQIKITPISISNQNKQKEVIKQNDGTELKSSLKGENNITIFPETIKDKANIPKTKPPQKTVTFEKIEVKKQIDISEPANMLTNNVVQNKLVDNFMPNQKKEKPLVEENRLVGWPNKTIISPIIEQNPLVNDQTIPNKNKVNETNKVLPNLPNDMVNDMINQNNVTNQNRSNITELEKDTPLDNITPIDNPISMTDSNILGMDVTIENQDIKGSLDTPIGEPTIPFTESLDKSIPVARTTNIESLEQLDEKEPMITPTNNEKPILKPGLSFLVHLDDENNFDLETSIGSICDMADEIILIGSGNNIPKEKLDKLKNIYNNLSIYQYNIDIQQLMAMKNSTNALIKYHNWCLSKVMYSNVIEWSSDYIPIKENLTKMIKKYSLRTRTDKYLLWFLGKKLYLRENNNFVDVKSSISARIFSVLNGFSWEEQNGKLTESKEYINTIKKPMINEDLIFFKVKNIGSNT